MTASDEFSLDSIIDKKAVDQGKDFLKQTLPIQDKLNTNTAGERWRSGVSANGKKIDWTLCIVQETSELIDSFPWKHWKDVDADPNIENAIVEIIDIWHFLASLILERTDNSVVIDKLLEIISRNAFLESFKLIKSGVETIDSEGVIDVSKQFISCILSDNPVSKDSMAIFGRLMAKMHITPEILAQRYMVKNTLNQFRQDHGYSDGSYIKEWNGIEDNVHALKIAYEKGIDNLYEELEKLYAAVCRTSVD